MEEYANDEYLIYTRLCLAPVSAVLGKIAYIIHTCPSTLLLQDNELLLFLFVLPLHLSGVLYFLDLLRMACNPRCLIMTSQVFQHLRPKSVE